MNRAEIEVVIIRRCKGYMDRTGLNTTTTDGSNGDCNDSIASALPFVGLTPTDRTSVVDADLSSLSGVTLEAYLDVVELRMLESVWARLYQVDTTAGPRRESLGQLRKDLSERLKDLRNRIQRQWAPYLDIPIEAGVGAAKVRAI